MRLEQHKRDCNINVSNQDQSVKLKEGEQTMSSVLTRIATFSSILTATAIPALAAEESRSNPSEPIVWGFIGFCALIIIAQIVPLFRNLNTQSKKAAEQSKTAEHQKL